MEGSLVPADHCHNDSARLQFANEGERNERLARGRIGSLALPPPEAYRSAAFSLFAKPTPWTR